MYSRFRLFKILVNFLEFLVSNISKYFLDTKRNLYSYKTFKTRSHFYIPGKRQGFADIFKGYRDGDVFGMSYVKAASQPTFTCSKLTIETLEQGAKYVQS